MRLITIAPEQKVEVNPEVRVIANDHAFDSHGTSKKSTAVSCHPDPIFFWRFAVKPRACCCLKAHKAHKARQLISEIASDKV